jgi:hypothetical protein
MTAALAPATPSPMIRYRFILAFLLYIEENDPL